MQMSDWKSGQIANKHPQSPGSRACQKTVTNNVGDVYEYVYETHKGRKKSDLYILLLGGERNAGVIQQFPRRKQDSIASELAFY